ncbi:hypothetical protein FA13DRAFT_1707513 [Coprinellus micaceus]|uniref:Uncharacterized protein n=1 Tax=Coprinellus micaceus TaxID=71717 RepID=A0A4Y7TKH0_COPMI|nr:hypothetical protein FA13DRAFT_1707513 [Coprinellus micaceus]
MPAQKGQGRNQHLPNHAAAPLDAELELGIARLFYQGKTDNQILDELRDGTYFDTTQYGIGKTRLREYKVTIGCLGARKEGLEVEDIREKMVLLREMYPWSGAREMVDLYLSEEKKKVRRGIVYKYFHQYEPELLEQRKGVVFKKKSWISGGVGHFWALDQHDKWKYKHGLCLHIGVEPFSGLILWL